MNRIFLCIIFVLCSSTALLAAGDRNVFPVDRDFYPYYPSLFKWEKSAAPFTEPQACADCHEKQYLEWNGSVHSMSLRDPIYQGELNKAVKAVGHEIGRQCEGCHSPAAMMSGELKKTGIGRAVTFGTGRSFLRHLSLGQRYYPYENADTAAAERLIDSESGL